MALRTRRTEKVVTYMEPFLNSIVIVECGRLGISLSEYLRDLVKEDLKTKGLLTDSMIAQHMC